MRTFRSATGTKENELVHTVTGAWIRSKTRVCAQKTERRQQVIVPAQTVPRHERAARWPHFSFPSSGREGWELERAEREQRERWWWWGVESAHWHTLTRADKQQRRWRQRYREWAAERGGRGLIHGQLLHTQTRTHHCRAKQMEKNVRKQLCWTLDANICRVVHSAAVSGSSLHGVHVSAQSSALVEVSSKNSRATWWSLIRLGWSNTSAEWEELVACGCEPPVLCCSHKSCTESLGDEQMFGRFKANEKRLSPIRVNAFQLQVPDKRRSHEH